MRAGQANIQARTPEATRETGSVRCGQKGSDAGRGSPRLDLSGPDGQCRARLLLEPAEKSPMRSYQCVRVGRGQPGLDLPGQDGQIRAGLSVARWPVLPSW